MPRAEAILSPLRPAQQIRAGGAAFQGYIITLIFAGFTIAAMFGDFLRGKAKGKKTMSADDVLGVLAAVGVAFLSYWLIRIVLH
jgi:hypothetical protein